MTKILLGKSADGDVTLDLEALMQYGLLVQGRSGSGKTTVLRRILEESHPHVQQIIIDPEGEFYTLRERYDYVIAGKGGDCAAEPRSAKLLARRLLELGVSAICDLYELKPTERIRFVRLFCEELIEAPRSIRKRPVLAVIDEAQMFAPEKGQAESLDAVRDLNARGRKRGVRPIFATQRLAKLAKDCADLGNKLIGATGLDLDQQRAGDDLGFSKAERLVLRDLPRGVFYAYGPALTPGVTRITVAGTRTQNPPTGHDLAAPAQPTPKIRALLSKVTDLPAEAAADARDNESLRRDLADTRRKLTLAEKAQRVETVQKPCDHEREIRELHARIDVEVEARETFRENWNQAGQRLEAIAGVLKAPLPRLPENVKAPPPAPVKPRGVVITVDRERGRITARDYREKPSTNGSAPDLEGITGGAMRMLQRLAERYPETWTRAQLATLAKVKRSGGTFGTYYSRLSQRGLIAEEGGRVSITDEGLDLMGGPPAHPQTHDELIESWRARLTGGARRMLDVLLDAGAHGVTRDQLAEDAEITMSGGTFGTYLSRLKTNGLAEQRGDRIVATDVLLGVPA